MKKKSVPFQFAVTAKDKKLWTTLCYWLWLRSKFKQPIFFNYTSSSIGKLIGVSHETANVHVQKMIKLGWAMKVGHHLKLISPNKLKKHDLIIPIQLFENKSEQIAALKYIFIRDNKDHQQKSIERKSEIVKKSKSIHDRPTKKMIKKVRNVGGIDNFEKTINSRITLGNKKIGEIFEISKRSASKLQVMLNKIDHIKSEPHYEEIIGYDFFKHHNNNIIYRMKFNTLVPMYRTTNTIIGKR